MIFKALKNSRQHVAALHISEATYAEVSPTETQSVQHVSVFFRLINVTSGAVKTLR